MIKNNKRYPLAFDFEFIGDDQIIAYILSCTEIELLEITTKISVAGDEKMVQLLKESGSVISESTYKILGKNAGNNAPPSTRR